MAERKPKNTSMIEVIVHKKEIDELLAKGLNYTLVFKKLKEQNKISCKYHAFLKATKNFCEKPKKFTSYNKKANQSKPTTGIEQQTGNVIQNTQQAAEQRHHAELQKKKNFILENYNPIEDVKKEND